MGRKISTQSFNWKIGIDHSHDRTDDEQKNENLRRIVKEKIDSCT